jgi:Zn-dependent M16 (insulinase) family peptidase
MRSHLKSVIFPLIVLFIAVASGAAAVSYGDLTEGQTIGQFKTEAVYTNADNRTIGARFRHVPSGFVLDVLGIQTAPQAFMWVNSVPPSDQGEPHTCEHLLLGKGTKGRYVASLESMSVGQSSAFTMQLQTCYHFNTSAGSDVFFNLFQAQLEALLHPNYSDEEIRREVCNMGIRLDPADSSLHLEEKGTVYNEMVSGFESPWDNMYFELGRMVHGATHPLSRNAGGFPDSIRNMVPADLRRFHDGAYHLNNMGTVVAIPDNIPLDDCLNRLSAIFAQLEPDAKTATDPATLGDRLPPLQPGKPGSTVITHYQSPNPQEPGHLVLAWPSHLTMDPRERYLEELFMANLAGDQSSILYRKLIDSKTRILTTGATSVGGWVSVDPGFDVDLAIGDLSREYLTAPMIDSLRRVVAREINAIATLSPGSPEWTSFVDQMKGRMIERKRSIRSFLNSPPRFGYRGTGSEWFYSLQRAAANGGFHRPLLFDREFAFVDSLLATGTNFWPSFLKKWDLTSVPYASAAISDTSLLAANEANRKARVDRFIAQLEKNYGVASDTAALRRFKGEYDKMTAVIDEEASKIPMPSFIPNPPMTLDDQIHYRTDSIGGTVPVLISTFDNLSGGTVGFAFNGAVVPESLLVYLPALPSFLTDVGMVKDGKALSYTEVQEAMRREILSLNVYYSTNYRTQRAELVARASGTDLDESNNALSWLQTALTSADLRPENLARMRDAIDQSLASARQRMRGSEESWVDEPALAYWRQSNPLLLSVDCFVTQTHSLQRLRWLLREPADAKMGEQFTAFLANVKSRVAGKDREAIGKLLDSLDTAYPAERTDGASASIRDAIADLKRNLTDIPDQDLSGDLSYLCEEILHDYNVPARTTLDQIKATLALLLNKHNARAFLIASGSTQTTLLPAMGEIAGKLGESPVMRQTYSSGPVIINRLKQRFPNLTKPQYVGFVDENTRSGVHYNTADCASYVDTSSSKLLDFLAARLYGGGGAHSMFMKTWGAGLAYSNGLRSSESSGRIIYYAERCPDLAQTMQFVVNELKKAPHDPSLGDYAVAQAFAGSRAASSYESRGEALAADMVDGAGPDIVTRFRKHIIDLKKAPDFYDNIQSRMEGVYGLVLPGYGPSATEAINKADANYFIIGPETQMQSYQNFLNKEEGNATLYRIYPRDYWLTIPPKPIVP